MQNENTNIFLNNYYNLENFNYNSNKSPYKYLEFQEISKKLFDY